MAEFNVFGSWLETTLKANRLTPAELHQRARISRAAVYHYLSGKRVPDDVSLGLIVSALGIETCEVPDFERKKVGRPSRISVA